MSSSNEDEEPKVCTVFASSSPSKSKTVFDAISFSVPKKEPSIDSEGLKSTSSLQTNTCDPSLALGTSILPPASAISETSENKESFTNEGETSEISPQPATTAQELAIPTLDTSHSIIPLEDPRDSRTITTESIENNDLAAPIDIFGDDKKSDVFGLHREDVAQEGFSISTDNQKEISEAMENLALDIKTDSSSTEQKQEGQGEGGGGQVNDDLDSPIPTTNNLFADAPEVSFPVGQCTEPPFLPQQQFIQTATTAAYFGSPAQGHGDPNFDQKQLFKPNMMEASQQSQLPTAKPMDTFSTLTYSTTDAAYDAWIPKETTRKVLLSIATAVHSGTYFADKSHMTTPGIIYEDDLMDKVGVNMSRIFGEAEASKRRILSADSVTQDDNGLRELIKLGCYRSAINLTKRLLTLYGQGPGKVGQFSKHNSHTLQLWFTRITLLVRIREFAIAESEIDAFKDFDNPDLYYEYYPDSFGGGRKGSMVPFHFRLLAAEILQYSRKHNETIDRLLKILSTVQQILKHIEEGIAEDGSGITIDGERKSSSLEIWRKREIRVYYSLANASLFSKDYQNTFKYLSLLCHKDKTKEPQLKSSIGRLFLQLGDLTTASKYFQEAADLRSGDSDTEQVENLIDAAMISIARGTYPDAYAILQQAVLIQPDNFLITNNMAVCLLYMGKVKDSLGLMETTVKNNTPELLQENVLLNLSTIYELENTDGHKKNSLLKLVSQYKGDGINLASLKMPNLI